MSKTHRRRGYTLIELLTVIAIIALLMSLLTVAAFIAIRAARIAAIGVDVQCAKAGMAAYKSAHSQYPPDLSDANPAIRQLRFQNHITLAHPRSVVSNYATLKGNILNNYQKAYGYNYKGPGGALTPLNLDTLDQAEALVFWLGGFPTPYATNGVPMGSGKLFGFSTDTTNPFRLDSGIGANVANRTTPLIDFDDRRLVDNDQDGWLEYIPPGPCQGTNGKTPPYVYFDAGGYTQAWSSETSPPFLGYPMLRPGDPNSQGAGLASAWGIAVPYATEFTNVNVPMVQWMEPKSFQIVTASLDGAYGNPNNANMRIPCFPSGVTIALPSLNQGYFDPEELDNITSAITGTIEDAAAR